MTNSPYQYSNIPNAIGEFIIGESPIGNTDTTNPATNASNFTNSFSFNPGAAITNIKIGTTVAFGSGGTINTYGRN